MLTLSKTDIDCVTFVQERWNQVVQELHEIEGSEQPTWFKQAPHGLFLNVFVCYLIMLPNELLSNCIENRMQRSASYCTYCTVRVAWKSQRWFRIVMSSLFLPRLMIFCRNTWLFNLWCTILSLEIDQIQLLQANIVKNSTFQGRPKNTLHCCLVGPARLDAFPSFSGT